LYYQPSPLSSTEEDQEKFLRLIEKAGGPDATILAHRPCWPYPNTLVVRFAEAEQVCRLHEPRFVTRVHGQLHAKSGAFGYVYAIVLVCFQAVNARNNITENHPDDELQKLIWDLNWVREGDSATTLKWEAKFLYHDKPCAKWS
jgi:hypothetical protein